MSCSGHASDDTLVNGTSKNKKRETKRLQNMSQPTKKISGKISDHVGHIFANELARGTNYLNASDVLEKFISPPIGTATHQTLAKATTVQTVTPIIEQIQSTGKSVKQRRKSFGRGGMRVQYKASGSIFSLDDRAAVTALEELVERFGKVSHMGILDKSYTFFVTRAHDAALYFKVYDRVAVVGGDPLCEPEKFDSMLDEFAAYRKGFGWGIAFLGATSGFAEYAARNRSWVTMHFGVERVLNPLTNPILLETGAGKRIISKSKELLRKNVSLGIYIPKYRPDSLLQEQLVSIYTDWCADRNDKPIVQAYMTILDPFAIPELMVTIYTRDADGKLCGFAALRKIINGYHLDPYVATKDAPRGISELLILSAMSLLQQVDISYLSLGFEPSAELGEITGMPKPAQTLTRSVHRRAYRGLPIGGKQGFFDKFHPDNAQQSDLYLIIPTRGIPRPKHMKALMHTANIDISRLIFEDVKKSLSKIRESRRGSGEEAKKGMAEETKEREKDNQHRREVLS